jgi:methylaspartate mutase epsilon subunit
MVIAEETMPVNVKNRRVDEGMFMQKRREWLDVWPTGNEVDYDESVAYLKSLPDDRYWSKVMARLRNESRMSVFPRAGTPILEDMIELCKSLADSGVVLIPVTTDSYTRQGAYEKVEQALEETKRTGKKILNGYPIINHGVKNTRKLVESCTAAFSARGAGGEIAIASGITSSGAGFFLGFGSYSKLPTLEQTIANFQYHMRLFGWYAERGVILSGDLHGWVPSGVFPLSVNIAAQVIEALVAAEQGHKSFTPLVHYQGYMAQDLAWSRLSPRIIREYLDKFGYQDAEICGVSPQHIPLYPVPLDLGGAFAYLAYTALVASLSKSESVSIRTVDEGAGVATQEAHQISYRAAKWIFDVVREQRVEFDMKEIETEEKLAETEVRALLDKLFDLGDGDIVVGAVKGVHAGFLDSPFSANIHIKDEVLGVRDARGACRYLEFGNLPLPKEIKDFHRSKVAEREKQEGKKLDYHTAVKDLWSFSKGKIVGLAPYNK